ncbi:MAG: DUF3352 domain-containing protein [Patescibacteria group bacterium]
MGRKSSLKKKRHDEEGEKTEHEQDDTEKVRFFTVHRFVQIFLAAGAIIVIGVLGQLIWQNLTAPRAIAQYMPADRTALIAEIDTDFERDEWKNFFNFFQNTPEFQKETWVRFLETQMNLNFEKQIQPWIGRKIGVAMLENGMPIYFIESKSEKKTIKFFQQFQLSGVEEKVEQKSYRGNDYYQFQVGNGSAMGFFGRYLAIAPSEKTMKELVDAVTDGKTLESGDAYHEETKKVGKNAQLFAYIDPKIVLQKITTFDKEKSSMLRPFFQDFGKQVWSGSWEDGKLLIENFIAAKGNTTREPYSRKLFAFAPQDPDFFYGNSNAPIQQKEMEKIIPPQTINAFLETQKKTWLGENATLQEAMSLFEQEYLVTKKDNEWRVITRLSKPQIQEPILEKIMTGFQEEKYKNFVIRSVENPDEVPEGGKKWKLSEALIGNTAILSTTKEGVEQAIDQFLSGKTAIDEKVFSEKFKGIEEIAFAKKEFFTPFIPAGWEKVLNKVSAITAGWTTEKAGVRATIQVLPQP